MSSKQRLLGAHMSIAGGYYKAVEAAAALNMDVVQLFTKNNNQWKAKPITQAEIDEFRAALKSSGVTHPVAHDSYLINLASPDDVLWEKSVDAFTVELERAEALGLIGVVMHPGSCMDRTEEEGLTKIVKGLDEAHRRTKGFSTQTLVEATAGQGKHLGYKFEHLAFIADNVAEPERVGICIDTCHLFAAGYPLATKDEYEATMKEFDRLVGVKRIKAFHLNDSVKDFGSRVDRHAKIGAGKMGLEPFRNLLNDSRFANIPMYLETPKELEDGEPLDAINLRTLRGLIEAK